MNSCNICGEIQFSREFHVDREDRFRSCIPGTTEAARYRECKGCNAFYYSGSLNFERIYHDGSYYSADSLDYHAMAKRLDFILDLPPEKSDNWARVCRIKAHLADEICAFSGDGVQSVLDVGAGMGVFLNCFLRDSFWQATAVEPDPTACALIRDRIPKAEVLEGYWSEGVTNCSYDLVTLNRVLEHVENPVELVRSLGSVVKPGGLVYVELPSVESYYKDGPNNEAFGYGHYTIYSKQSVEILARRAGYSLCQSQLVQEPSGKFTIYCFLTR